MSQHVKYHIILENLKEYGYQGLDPGSKFHYLLKMSTAVAAVKALSKNFDTVITFLTQYIDKQGPTPSVKVLSITHARPPKQQKTNATCGTFKGKINLKKYSREKYSSMLTVWQQTFYELKVVRLYRIEWPL